MGLISEQPREIELPELRLVGAMTLIDFCEGDDNAAFGEVWERFFTHLESLSGARTNPERMFGLNLFPPAFPADRRWYYGACVEVDTLDRDFSSAFVSRCVPASTHLAFEVQGTVAEIAPAYDRAWELVAPRFAGETGCPVNLELYDERFLGPDNPESRTDLLFAVTDR